MMRVRHLVGSSAHGADPIRIQNSASLKWLRGAQPLAFYGES